MYCQRCGNHTEMREIDGKQRPVCSMCGAVTFLDPKLAVAVVIERAGEILLGRRGEGTREPGKWSFPAGFVDRGEIVEHAALREVLEETGLDVTLGPLLGVYSTQGEPVVLLAYSTVGIAGTATANDDLSEIGWFSPDAISLIDLAFPHDLQILLSWQSWRATRALS